jgi:hypothetical protein
LDGTISVVSFIGFPSFCAWAPIAIKQKKATTMSHLLFEVLDAGIDNARQKKLICLLLLINPISNK